MKVSTTRTEMVVQTTTSTVENAIERLLDVRIPEEAKVNDLQKLAYAAWAIVTEGQEETMGWAVKTVEIAGNVILERHPGRPSPRRMAGTSKAIYGAFETLRLVLEVGRQDASEKHLAAEFLTTDLWDIVRILARGDATGSDLARELGVDKSTISRKLQQLRELGVLHRVRGTGRGSNALTQVGRRALEHLDAMERDDGFHQLQRRVVRRVEHSSLNVYTIFEAKLDIETREPAMLGRTPWGPSRHPLGT